MSPPRKPVITRVWAKVNRSGGPDSCWNWTAPLSNKGYGRIGEGGRRCKMVMATRVVWEATFGPLTKKEFVLHRCDNPACCNPAHFFKGTQKQNLEDMVAKGRHRNQNTNRLLCKRGHPFTGVRQYESRSFRFCRECLQLRSRMRRAKNAITAEAPSPVRLSDDGGRNGISN